MVRSCPLFASLLLVTACWGPGGVDRVERIDPADIERVLAGGRLQTAALGTWFEYEGQQVYRLEVPGAEALAWWRTLRGAVATSGYWPILVGSPEDAGMIDEMLRDDDFPAAELAPDAVAAFDLAAWRAERSATYREWGEDPHGPWPLMGAAPMDFTVDTDILTGELRPRVTLALLPTRHGWQAPLILRYGGWNECPVPRVQAATLADWERRYGAEPVSMTGDVVEMAVARPPSNRDDATALAVEQYLYCGDIVWQGTETIEQLAASLVDAPVWYFWWD